MYKASTSTREVVRKGMFDRGLRYTVLASLVVFERSRVMPTTISSETSPPASIIFFVSTPSGDFFRNLLAQHVARCEVAQNSSGMRRVARRGENAWSGESP
jgi:hypothetical protein